MAIKLFLLLLIHSSISRAMEYFYPVSQIDNSSIFYVYQKSLSDIELYRYDSLKEKSYKQLYWRFIPFNTKLLSDKSGFSFIDSDRLRIKKFNKRSPGAIDFPEAIWSISGVEWIGKKNQCIFSARQKENLNIYLGDTQELALSVLASSRDCDYFCPCYLSNKVYCIKRSCLDRECFITQISLLEKEQNKLCENNIFNCDYKQIIHLQMIDNKSGFFVEHMPYIGDQNKIIKFICHKFEKVNNVWQSTKIFSFKVLKDFLVGDNRIFESFKIFMPRVKKRRLYFASAKQNKAGEWYSSIYRYNLISKKLECILSGSPKSYLFAPLAMEERVFCGKAFGKSVIDNKFNFNVEYFLQK